jgi:hypothetical protein
MTVEDGLVKSKDSYIDAVSMQAQLGLSGRSSTESFWRTA